MTYFPQQLKRLAAGSGVNLSGTDLAKLNAELSDAALEFRIRRSAHGIRSKKRRLEALAAVESGAAKVLSAINKNGTPTYSYEESEQNFLTLLEIASGSFKALSESLMAVERLHRWARDARQKHASPIADIHKGVTPENWLTGIELPRIFETYFRLPFGTASRPGTDFVVSCAKLLGVPTNRAAIKKFRSRNKQAATSQVTLAIK